MDLQALTSFPGIRGTIDSTVSLTDGISPSAIRLRILPQPMPLAEYGDFTITFGDRFVRLADCRVDYGSAQFDAEGEVWEIAIWDRRWRWRYGLIRGAYNVRDENGNIRADTLRTVQQLAVLCLDAMGEDLGVWDLGGLPNQTWPEVNWDNTLPAEALARLAEQFNCRVCPDFAQRGGRIMTAGEGYDFPAGGVMEAGATYDPPEKPTRVGILCGPTRYEPLFTLEAVGQENDKYGTIKPIDELSYCPDGGWGRCADDFTSITSEKARECAERSVFKWYRVKLGDGVTFPPADWLERPIVISNIRHILLDDARIVDTADIQPNQSTTTIDAYKPRPIIYGEWWQEYEGKEANLTSTIIQGKVITGEKEQPKIDFTIDALRRMVIFDKPIYRSVGTAPELLAGEADIKLSTCCNIIDPTTGDVVRDRRWTRRLADASAADDVTHWLPHDEIVFQFRQESAAVGTFNWRAAGNYIETVVEVGYYLDAAERAYSMTPGATRRYAGIIPCQLDGAIRQVTYIIGQQGAETVIARNCEHPDYVVPYRTRRAWEKQRALQRETEPTRPVQ